MSTPRPGDEAWDHMADAWKSQTRAILDLGNGEAFWRNTDGANMVEMNELSAAVVRRTAEFGLIRHQQSPNRDTKPAPKMLQIGTPGSSAWLIENERGFLCLGMHGQSLAWVSFSDESALRFSRQTDAERMRKFFEEQIHHHVAGSYLRDARIAEHIWV